LTCDFASLHAAQHTALHVALYAAHQAACHAANYATGNVASNKICRIACKVTRRGIYSATSNATYRVTYCASPDSSFHNKRLTNIYNIFIVISYATVSQSKILKVMNSSKKFHFCFRRLTNVTSSLLRIPYSLIGLRSSVNFCPSKYNHCRAQTYLQLMCFVPFCLDCRRAKCR